MDPIKTGKFLASLRRQQNLTQEALGERLGVSNKTISRWENGNYMPDIDMLQTLSQTFGVSINELLSGEFLSDEDFRKKAEENVVAVAKSSAEESVFRMEDRRSWYIRKWRREHIALFVLLGAAVVLAAVLPFVLGKPWLACCTPAVMLLAYAYQNNRMMAYVEHHLYDGQNRNGEDSRT